MDFSLEFLRNYNDFIAETFHVNPAVFIAIYVIMTPSYYYGWYKVGREAFLHVKSRRRSRKKVSLHDLFLEKGFLEGYTINRISWAAPYFYVFIWGNEIPRKYYLLILTWFFVSLYIFTHNINTRYINPKKK
jgi:hypothetical protein